MTADDYSFKEFIYVFVCLSPHSPNGDQPVQHVETVPVWHGLDHLARGGSLHLEEALGGEAKDGAGEFVSIGATFVLKLFDGLDIRCYSRYLSNLFSCVRNTLNVKFTEIWQCQ